MGDLELLLAKEARDLEPELQRRLTGFVGAMLRAYLPQVWVFATDHGTASLVVSTSGTVAVSSGASESPDVTIHVPYARLEAAIRSRGRETVPPDAIVVSAHTVKGKTAFDRLRGRLGL